MSSIIEYPTEELIKIVPNVYPIKVTRVTNNGMEYSLNHYGAFMSDYKTISFPNAREGDLIMVEYVALPINAKYEIDDDDGYGDDDDPIYIPIPSNPDSGKDIADTDTSGTDGIKNNPDDGSNLDITTKIDPKTGDVTISGPDAPKIGGKVIDIELVPKDGEAGDKDNTKIRVQLPDELPTDGKSNNGTAYDTKTGETLPYGVSIVHNPELTFSYTMELERYVNDTLNNSPIPVAGPVRIIITPTKHIVRHLNVSNTLANYVYIYPLNLMKLVPNIINYTFITGYRYGNPSNGELDYSSYRGYGVLLCFLEQLDNRGASYETYTLKKFIKIDERFITETIHVKDNLNVTFEYNGDDMQNTFRIRSDKPMEMSLRVFIGVNENYVPS